MKVLKPLWSTIAHCLRDGGIIRDGYHKELDELRKLAAGGKQWIAEYQAREAERIGVTNLKVGFNKVFGYYLELSNSNKDKAPEEYIRKQTLKNAERYITPELKEYEEEVLSSDDKAKALEYELFIELHSQVHEAQTRLKRTADQLAALDVLQSLAELAVIRGYCRPVMDEQPILEIREGRHPVLDITEPDGTFVPNDTIADHRDKNLLLITGLIWPEKYLYPTGCFDNPVSPGWKLCASYVSDCRYCRSYFCQSGSK